MQGVSFVSTITSVKCPHCRTVLTKGTAVCWRCGTTVASGRALLSRINRFGTKGRGVLMALIGSLLLLLLLVTAYISN